MRLLLVEDSARLRRSLKMGLTRAGYTVDDSGNGCEGLWKAKNQKYDLLILDIILPGLDGLELLRRLRAKDIRTHVLLLTARDAVGGDRSALDHSLRVIAVVLALMVVVTSVLSAIIVRLVLRGGLSPLEVVSSQVAQIDESNLARRIDPSHLPDEVRPTVEKLNDLLGRLEVSFARERHFNANVSHELRTPVAELRTMAEVMLQGETHAPPVQRAFEDAREIALKMEALVTTLLEMVRHETAATPLVLTDVPLPSLVQSTWQKRRTGTAERDIRLVLTP